MTVGLCIVAGLGYAAVGSYAAGREMRGIEDLPNSHSRQWNQQNQKDLAVGVGLLWPVFVPILFLKRRRLIARTVRWTAQRLCRPFTRLYRLGSTPPRAQLPTATVIKEKED